MEELLNYLLANKEAVGTLVGALVTGVASAWAATARGRKKFREEVAAVVAEMAASRDSVQSLTMNVARLDAKLELVIDVIKAEVLARPPTGS